MPRALQRSSRSPTASATFAKKDYVVSPEEMLLDRAQLMGLTVRK